VGGETDTQQRRKRTTIGIRGGYREEKSEKVEYIIEPGNSWDLEE